MNPIDETAAIFFADLILPLRRANVRRGIGYLDRGPARSSYWTAATSRTGGLQKLPGTGCDVATVLGMLGQYWEQRNERHLLQLLPHLQALQRALATPTPERIEPRLTDFVYPLF
jgi:hypothetical protein